MKKVIHARFGQFMFDAYNPSNVEVFFEFLNSFDEVKMPNGQWFRMTDAGLELLTDDGWEFTETSVNYIISLVRDLTPEDWQAIKQTAKVHNIVDFSDFNRP
jgi:hypothetical protein